MTLPLGEVVLIRMKFHQAAGSRFRPAVVVLDTGDEDFVAAPITSRARHSEYDFPLEDWQGAGLDVASNNRVHKLTVLAKADIISRLARLSERDHENLLLLLCRVFCESAIGT